MRYSTDGGDDVDKQQSAAGVEHGEGASKTDVAGNTVGGTLTFTLDTTAATPGVSLSRLAQH